MHTQRGLSRISIALQKLQVNHPCSLSNTHNYRRLTYKNNQGQFCQQSQVQVSIKPNRWWLLQIHFGKLTHSLLVSSSILIHIQHIFSHHMLSCLHIRILKGKTTWVLTGPGRQYFGNILQQNSQNDLCNGQFELNYVKLHKFHEMTQSCMCKIMIIQGTCNNCFYIIDAFHISSQVTSLKAVYMGPLYTD